MLSLRRVPKPTGPTVRIINGLCSFSAPTPENCAMSSPVNPPHFRSLMPAMPSWSPSCRISSIRSLSGNAAAASFRLIAR